MFVVNSRKDLHLGTGFPRFKAAMCCLIRVLIVAKILLPREKLNSGDRARIRTINLMKQIQHELSKKNMSCQNKPTRVVNKLARYLIKILRK